MENNTNTQVNNQKQEDAITVEVEEVKDWKNISEEFTEELQKDWESRGFSHQECKEWIIVGMNPDDSGYCAWLRDIKRKDAEWTLNQVGWLFNYIGVNKLRNEYDQYLKNCEDSSEEIIGDLKINEEVAKQIRNLENAYCSKVSAFRDKHLHSYYCLPQEKRSLVNKIILNETLKTRYERYGLCQECNQPKTGENWCQPCNYQNWFFDRRWISGNKVIDKFIHEYQLKATRAEEVLEWIPWNSFTDIQYLAKGGFGKVYKAKWIDGYVTDWDIENSKWNRSKKNKIEGKNNWEYFSSSSFSYVSIVLKSLNNSQNITTEFLQEVANHKLFGSKHDYIVPCYGISQDPETKNYVIVMEYVKGLTLNQEVDNNFGEIKFEQKLRQLHYIAKGLENIHSRGLVHRDFHPGNILTLDGYVWCYITDLGLSKPASEEDKSKAYGVMPYVAPEVLNKKKGEPAPYSKASDIYSFSIVIWQVLSGLPPHYNIPHDIDLALKICGGLRPEFRTKIPSLLKHYINQCWDVDPSKRPTAERLANVFWNMAYYGDHQDKEEERKYDEELKIPPYDGIKAHPEAVYHSRNLPTEEVSSKLSEAHGSKDLDLNLDNLDIGNSNWSEDNDKTTISSSIIEGELNEQINIDKVVSVGNKTVAIQVNQEIDAQIEVSNSYWKQIFTNCFGKRNK